MRPALLAALLALACGRGATEHTVTMRAMAFDPAVLEVRAGDRVVFRNEDLVAHTATAAGRFDSGPIDPGKSYTVTLPKAGELRYACTLHPMMAAKLSVR